MRNINLHKKQWKWIKMFSNKKAGKKIVFIATLSVLLIFYLMLSVAGLTKSNSANKTTRTATSSPSPTVTSPNPTAPPQITTPPKTTLSDQQWQDMIDSCTTEGHKIKDCICLYKYTLNNYTLDEIASLRKEYYNSGKIPQVFQDAATSCGVSWIE